MSQKRESVFKIDEGLIASEKERKNTEEIF